MIAGNSTAFGLVQARFKTQALRVAALIYLKVFIELLRCLVSEMQGLQGLLWRLNQIYIFRSRKHIEVTGSYADPSVHSLTWRGRACASWRTCSLSRVMSPSVKLCARWLALMILPVMCILALVQIVCCHTSLTSSIYSQSRVLKHLNAGQSSRRAYHKYIQYATVLGAESS